MNRETIQKEIERVKTALRNARLDQAGANSLAKQVGIQFDVSNLTGYLTALEWVLNLPE